MSSNAPRQLRASEPAGPLHAPAADVDTGLAQSAGSALPAWSDSPRQLKQGAQLTQLQAAASSATPAQGGLPQGLRQGIESMSGLDMSGVRVHRNSSKPAALQAHAYAQGQDIHLGPGQEKHLPHEAWHVVQQAQGRVRPTLQMKAGIAVNDDAGLEREADVMGSKAEQRSMAVPQLHGTAPAVTSSLQRGQEHAGPGLGQAAAVGISSPILQAVWVRAEDSHDVTWVDTNDLSNYEVTEEEHAEAEGHPKGMVYIRKKQDLQPAMTQELDVAAAAQRLSTFILNDKSQCAVFFQYLDSTTLWAYSRTSTISRKMAQAFVITYFPRYEDRFIFNLATKGLLLRTRPSEKYGGQLEKSSYPEHASSGFNWYSAALTGNGVMVLGDLNDYALMRDFDSLFHSKEQAKSVEQNAKYLMAWPWSLLVNSALVTGAIHGGRPVIGASPISEKSVYKKPDGKDTFGMTVYAREMIQLILKHRYGIKTQTDPHEASQLGYPEPALGGGFLLTPTQNPRRPVDSKRPYATIFDVGVDEESLFGREDQAQDLVSALNPPKYQPIHFDPTAKDQVDTEGKLEKKAYDRLRKNMKAKLEKYSTLDRLVPMKLGAMNEAIYPDGPKALPSIPRWLRVQYENDLHAIPDADQPLTFKLASTSSDPEVSRYYQLLTQKSLMAMQLQEEGNYDEWADLDEYFSGSDLADWYRLIEQFGPIEF